MKIQTLRDRVRFPFTFDCDKHGLAPDSERYADEQINKLTPTEFLQAISDALEEVLGDALAVSLKNPDNYWLP